MQPTPEELEEWANNAARRNAVLPETLQIAGRQVGIVCGSCHTAFQRTLIPKRNDPVYICPACNARNYVPVEW